MAKRIDASPYDRAFEGILSYIDEHGLGARDRLPSERELCQELDVSRTTLRSALSRLASMSVIECRQGAGNYLCPERPTTHLEDLSGFTEIAAKAGRTTASRILRCAVEPATGEVAGSLYLPTDDPVFTLSRLRFVDDTAVCLETTHLSAAAYPGIERVDFNDRSLYEVLAERYGVLSRHAAIKVTVARATDEEADPLCIEPGSLVFLERGTRMDADMEPIEYSRAVYVPSRFRIVCDSHLTRTGY